MKKGFITLGMLLALAACEEPTQEQLNIMTEQSFKYLTYVQDKRTGFCFAKSGVQGGYTYATVECTDEVKALLVNTAE